MSIGIFVAVILILVVSGYRYGLAVLLGRLVALCGGYLGAFFFVHQAEQWLVLHSSIKGLDALILAAGVCFFASYFVVGGVYRLLRALLSRKNVALSAQSRIAGAVLGSGMGVVLGVVAVWLVGMKQDMALAKVTAGSGVVRWDKPDAVRQMSDQSVATIVNEIMRVVGHADAVTAQASGHVIAAPVRVSAGLRQLANAPEFRTWLEDPQAQEMMARGQVEQLIQMENFQALTNVPQNIDAIRILQGAPTASPSVAVRQFAEMSATVWQKIQRVKSDPEFQRLASDPEIAHLVQEPNAVQLMRSEKARALAELILTGHSTGSATSGTNVISDRVTENPTSTVFNDAPAEDVVKPTEVIFQWKDADGHVQFGDKPAPGALNIKQIK